MRNNRRLSALGLIGAAAISLAACSNSEQAAGGGGNSSAPEKAPASSSSSAPSSSSSAAGGGSGVTTAKDVFGPACGKVPKSGEGSVSAMKEQPVGTAASTNPLLKTLTKAAKKADLVPTLNKADAKYTVFAPADAAFDKVPKDKLNSLLGDKDMLTKVLTEHVLPQRLDKEGLLKGKSFTAVNKEGGKLTVSGSGDDITVTDPTGQKAKVLCGNVPTANATVFVIDTVMSPQKSG